VPDWLLSTSSQRGHATTFNHQTSTSRIYDLHCATWSVGMAIVASVHITHPIASHLILFELEMENICCPDQFSSHEMR